MDYKLRPRMPDPAEETFLYALYASTRAEEMALVEWNAAEQEKFLRFQFSAQEQAYLNDYPGCEDQVVEVAGQPAGRLLTWQSGNSLCLLDIALLPEYRNRGIGSELVRSVMAQGEREGRLVWLYVMFNNPAAERLYQRLGFTRREMVGPFYVMDWQPEPVASVEN
jgi:ribosomal protein S18 acetylase RimI-like enzyme